MAGLAGNGNQTDQYPILYREQDVQSHRQDVDKPRRPRLDCFFRSSLISVFPVCYSRPLVKSAYQNINFLISQPKHVVGTQKNRLNETVLMITQNICSNRWIRKYLQFNDRRLCVVSLSKNINPSLVLVQPRKTCHFITERLLMGSQESNQTNFFYLNLCYSDKHFANSSSDNQNFFEK